MAARTTRNGTTCYLCNYRSTLGRKMRLTDMQKSAKEHMFIFDLVKTIIEICKY